MPHFPCATNSAPVTLWNWWGPDLRPFAMTVGQMQDETGTVLEEPRTPQMIFRMKLPKAVPPYTLVRHAVELSAK